MFEANFRSIVRLNKDRYIIEVAQTLKTFSLSLLDLFSLRRPWAPGQIAFYMLLLTYAFDQLTIVDYFSLTPRLHEQLDCLNRQMTP